MSEITFTGPSGFRTSVTHQRLYSDTTPMIKMDDFNEVIDRANTIIVRPKSLASFVEAMFLVDSLTAYGAVIDYLVLPYVPGARQDRINETGDVLYTSMSVAKMINERGFEKVLILDPHSAASVRYLDRAEEYPLTLLAPRVWQGYTGIIAADHGGRTRAEEFAKAMNKPIFYGSKHRDVSTGKLSGFGVETLPEGGHFLVVDDICDGGGTFVGLGEQIAAQGCHADLFVTHGIFSKGSSELRKVYKNIYTTDSRFIHDKHVHIIPVIDDMEKYL